MTKKPKTRLTAYVTCPVCSGYVLHINTYNGEVDDGCTKCGHTGYVRVRDERGRFSCREVRAA